MIEEREGEMEVGGTEKRGRERKMKRGEGKQGGRACISRKWREKKEKRKENKKEGDRVTRGTS
jgi:hypothetical protein